MKYVLGDNEHLTVKKDGVEFNVDELLAAKPLVASSQNLTEAEKMQARLNIGAIGAINTCPIVEQGVYITDNNLYVAGKINNSGNLAILMPGADFSDLNLGQVTQDDGSSGSDSTGDEFFIGAKSGPSKVTALNSETTVFITRYFDLVFSQQVTNLAAIYIKCISATGPISEYVSGKLIMGYGSYSNYCDAPIYDTFYSLTFGEYDTFEDQDDVERHYIRYIIPNGFALSGVLTCEVGVVYNGTLYKGTLKFEED